MNAQVDRIITFRRGPYAPEVVAIETWLPRPGESVDDRPLPPLPALEAGDTMKIEYTVRDWPGFLVGAAAP